DVLAGAMHLGVVTGPGGVAVPGAVGPAAEGACQAPLQEAEVPGAVLGEGLQGLPVGHAVQSDEGLGDGVLLDVEGQAGDPLDEALLAATGEAHSNRYQDGLPERPQLDSFHHAPPGTLVVEPAIRQGLPGRC